VTYLPTAKQRPQHTRGQQYRSRVSVVRAAIVAMQRAIQAANNGGDVFSVLGGPCRGYLRETV
jgi:hypothetical protein